MAAISGGVTLFVDEPSLYCIPKKQNTNTSESDE
jgi:hypothetical protein